MRGGSAHAASQGLQGATNIDDQGARDRRRRDPFAGFILDLQAGVRRGLQQKSEKLRVLVGAYALGVLLRG